MMMTRGKTLALAAGLVLLAVSLAPAQVPIRVRRWRCPPTCPS